MPRLMVAAVIAIAAAIAGWLGTFSTYTSPYYDGDPAKPHHTRDGFRNNYAQITPPQFWKWQWERFRDGLPRPATGPTPRIEADVAFLRANATEPTLTWLGHATVLLQVGSYNILTDPHLTERASPVSFYGPKRHVPPGLAFGDMPRIDVVLISHNHHDHLDAETVKRLNAQDGSAPMFVVPLGLEQWMRDLGVKNVVELDWWDRLGVGGLDVHLVPVQHWSARSLTDRNRTLWGGFYVKHRNLSFVYTGDTGHSKDFADIRQRLGAPDIAVIPVGACEPRWFMQNQHVDPAGAVKIHQDLGAKFSLGVHWGTFELSDESLDEPPRALSVARVEAGVPAERFFVMKVGETRRLSPLLGPPRF